MKPIIFLDIDGVINPHRPIHTAPVDYELNKKLADQKNDPGFLKLYIYFTNQIYYGFDKTACILIKKLIEEFDAKIVLTSSWRLLYSKKDLYYLFKILHMESAFMDITEDIIPRYKAIEDYIQKHKVTDYIVIDDADLGQHFGFHQIKTVNSFTLKDFIRAQNLLKLQKEKTDES